MAEVIIGKVAGQPERDSSGRPMPWQVLSIDQNRDPDAAVVCPLDGNPIVSSDPLRDDEVEALRRAGHNVEVLGAN